MTWDERHEAAARWLGITDDMILRPEIVDAIVDGAPDLSAWPPEMVETLGKLTDHDREQVLTFAAFLQALRGTAPATVVST
jgi:hypothetical protein